MPFLQTQKMYNYAKCAKNAGIVILKAFALNLCRLIGIEF